ncbi:YciI family protein [Nocardia sp. NPDC127526]|uniref:YciI family protein n=1 Tax=Nocardia sp. NPDC127526 TaxID=3345393 RepID=UPI0036327439
MPIFAVHYTYTEATVPARAEHRPEHRAFLNNLVDQGIVLTSGPYTDGLGALILFQAPDAETVHKLLDEDPFQREGLVEARRVAEWQPVMGAFVS